MISMVVQGNTWHNIKHDVKKLVKLTKALIHQYV